MPPEDPPTLIKRRGPLLIPPLPDQFGLAPDTVQSPGPTGP